MFYQKLNKSYLSLDCSYCFFYCPVFTKNYKSIKIELKDLSQKIFFVGLEHQGSSTQLIALIFSQNLKEHIFVVIKSPQNDTFKFLKYREIEGLYLVVSDKS